MFKGHVLTLLTVLLMAGNVLGQTGGKLKATINDSYGEPIAGATIVVENTQKGGATNGAGYLELDLPAGQFKVVVSAVGFKSVTEEVAIASNKDHVLNTALSEDVLGLEQVVVSANREALSREDASIPVQVMNAELLTNVQAVTLAEGLAYQPGLRVENNCQNCGFTSVRINGMEGAYSQILMDSRPVFSALNGVYGLEHIPSNMIERIEVIRGGGSSLYGGNAIAGTINVITREPLNNELELSTTQSVGDDGNWEQVYSIGGNLVNEDMTAGLSVYGSYRDRDEWDANGDGFSDLTAIAGGAAGMKGYYKPSAYNKLTMNAHYISEDRRGGNKLDLAPHEADVAEWVDHEIIGGGLTFDQFTHNYKHKMSFYASAQQTKRDSYYGSYQDPNAYGFSQSNSVVAGGRYNTDVNTFGGENSITAGIEYLYEDMEDVAEGYGRTINQEVGQLGTYVQSDWEISNSFKLLTGLRLEKHNLIDNPILVPRVNLKYRVNDKLQMRGGYARGFRGPQAFDEDLHISTVGGEANVIRLSEDLKPEYSDSYTYSLDFDQEFGAWDLCITVDAFYTKLKDAFITEAVGEEDGNLILEKRNGTGATVQGISITPQLASRWLVLQGGITYQKSRYDEAVEWSEEDTQEAEDRFLYTPDLYGFYTATVFPVKNLNINLSGNYTGKMLVPHYAGYIEEDRMEEVESTFVHNIKVGYTLDLGNWTSMEINAGIKNYTNRYQEDLDMGADRDAGYVYGAMAPRTYFMGLKFSI